ncbi:hypothetical protein H6P81_018147 [Aristolochia fimbriata]|uniref:Uncharacterized protein n=1 Tax=Aristolochia fimbriata TaxID=158543 RepID=A0AAV7E4H6_ARIFI|nr:hypothetical protein H6P81_018147 [Aristolochia fimbriata]
MEIKLKGKAAIVTICHDPDPDPEPLTSSCCSIAALAFLTVNTLVSLVRARNDLPAAAFVVSVYAVLMLLYWCLHAVEKMPEDSPRRERLKLPVWALATTLNFLFAYRVSAMLPATLGWLVWGLAGACCAATFYALLLYDAGDAKYATRCKIEVWSGSEPVLAEEV